MTGPTKICTACSVAKPITEFPTRLVRGKTCPRTNCKSCYSADQKARREARAKAEPPPVVAKQNAPMTAIEVDPVEQMALMDGFSPELRQVIYQAPVPLDLRQVAPIYRSYRLTAPQRLMEIILGNYPDWVPG